MPEDWRQYQEEVAEFFRSLGATASVDHCVDGVRSRHRIDVWVTFEKWGLQHTWAVECKRHCRPITKADVETLKSIVSEVGASLGFLLSESGFQSGAFDAVRNTNIILSSLEELRLKSREDVMLRALSTLEFKALELRERLSDFMLIEQNKPSRLRDGVEVDKYFSLLGSIALLGMALDRIRLGTLPVVLPGDFDVDPDAHVVCTTIEEFVTEASRLLERVDSWTARQRPE